MRFTFHYTLFRTHYLPELTMKMGLSLKSSRQLAIHGLAMQTIDTSIKSNCLTKNLDSSANGISRHHELSKTILAQSSNSSPNRRLETLATCMTQLLSIHDPDSKEQFPETYTPKPTQSRYPSHRSEGHHVLAHQRPPW